MRFLDKIFNASASNKTDKLNEEVTNGFIAFYRNKYQQMEKNGKYIDWWEFDRSIENKWPYPVATEAERRSIDSSDKQVLRNHAFSISNLLHEYSKGMLEDANDGNVTIYKDIDKVGYWKDVLVRGAKSGDQSFQAALITKMGVYDGFVSEWMSEQEQNNYIEQYEVSLIKNAKAGDADAMYAVAQFGIGDAQYGSEYRKILAEKAMNAGSGDAAFLCAEIYKSDSYLNGNSWEYSDVMQYYVRGVDCNNGAMLGVMLDGVAEAYCNGEYGFPKDLDMAIYLYNMAVENGNNSARSTLEIMREKPELFR